MQSFNIGDVVSLSYDFKKRYERVLRSRRFPTKRNMLNVIVASIESNGIDMQGTVKSVDTIDRLVVVTFNSDDVTVKPPMIMKV